jgi:hypothetical protein
MRAEKVLMTQIHFNDLGIVLNRFHAARSEQFALVEHGDLVGNLFDEFHVMLNDHN